MRPSVLRAVVIAGVLLLGFVPTAFAQGRMPALAASGPAGYDISWPQCDRSYPSTAGFGIVGVNRGIVFSANPCLASELTWAGGASAGLYANTGNPGPALSTHWPKGQTTPQVCDAANPDSAACAYDYGYNAAADAYAVALTAFSALGLAQTPAAGTWWLDVETSNSWRSDVSLNVAALGGAAEYLGSVAKVATLGFYSTAYQWNVITGGTTAFGAYGSWVAGASDAQAASVSCLGPGFTGGGVVLVQYPLGGFDADLRCTSATPVLNKTITSVAASLTQVTTAQLTGLR